MLDHESRIRDGRWFRSSLASLFFIIVCSYQAPAWSAFYETYQLTLGTSLNDFDTRIRFSSRDDSIDNEIDLEDTLGFDQEVRLAWLRGSWRMAENHQLNLLYTPIERTSYFTSQKDITAEGNTILAGAQLSSSVSTHVFDIEYIYSVYKQTDIEIGISAGIYWMNSLAEMSGSAEVIREGSNDAERITSFETSQRLIAPLPLIGLTADYAIDDRWVVRGSARYLDVTIGDIEGYVLNFNMSAEYDFTRHIGAGIAFSSFDVAVKHNGVVFINTLSYEYLGLQGYLVFKY